MAIATEDVVEITNREVDKQLGRSDHKPIFLTIESPPEIYQSPSCNLKKANLVFFKKLADDNITLIN